MLKRIFKHEATHGLLKVKAAIALLGFILAFPSLQNNYFINKLGDSVVPLNVPSHHGSGGTGFHFVAPDGKTYILTNRHVCEAGENDILDAEYHGKFYPVKIIKMSEKTDVCLMEAIKGVKGVRFASSDAKFGEDIFVVGHPYLEDRTLSKGQTGNIKNLTLEMDAESPEECIEKGGKIEQAKVRTPFGIMEIAFCVKQLQALRTSAVIYPGNSGSPLFNIWGHVTGILFAGNSRDNYGYAIPLSNIMKFLTEECGLHK